MKYVVKYVIRIPWVYPPAIAQKLTIISESV